jgi:predicted transcriptional regulator of viral defense system
LPLEALDYLAACKKFAPLGAVGGLSALFEHRLLNETPKQIWVMVPPNMITIEPLYRLIRTKTPLTIGIEEKDGYRITNLERTLIEALRYRSKWGLSTALAAIRHSLISGDTSIEKLGDMAKELGFRNLFLKYFEIISPESLDIA